MRHDFESRPCGSILRRPHDRLLPKDLAPKWRLEWADAIGPIVPHASRTGKPYRPRPNAASPLGALKRQPPNNASVQHAHMTTSHLQLSLQSTDLSVLSMGLDIDLYVRAPFRLTPSVPQPARQNPLMRSRPPTDCVMWWQCLDVHGAGVCKHPMLEQDLASTQCDNIHASPSPIYPSPWPAVATTLESLTFCGHRACEHFGFAQREFHIDSYIGERQRCHEMYANTSVREHAEDDDPATEDVAPRVAVSRGHCRATGRATGGC